MADIYIDKNEAASLVDFLENHFIESIRKDPDIDNIQYICNIIRVYERCNDEITRDRIKQIMGG